MIHKKLVRVAGQREVRESSDWDKEKGIIFTKYFVIISGFSTM